MYSPISRPAPPHLKVVPRLISGESALPKTSVTESAARSERTTRSSTSANALSDTSQRPARNEMAVRCTTSAATTSPSSPSLDAAFGNRRG
eukprot:scaffold163638_cov33-Tisochrysis_lutea.AAC.2